MLNWFKSKSHPDQPLQVDIHSHLLPGIDDGVRTLEESALTISRMKALGYNKLVTTPHIMSDAFKNTPEIISEKLQLVRQHLAEQNIDISIEAAAEYYLDETLMRSLAEPLLKIGNRYLLFETNFLSEPLFLNEFIFEATTKGYQLVLAHPERYLYLQQKFSKAEDLLNRGVLFQLNIISLIGHYSKPAQQMCKRLIDKGWVHWLGTDCHQPQQTDIIANAMTSKYFEKAVHLPLLNNSLL